MRPVQGVHEPLRSVSRPLAVPVQLLLARHRDAPRLRVQPRRGRQAPGLDRTPGTVPRERRVRRPGGVHGPPAHGARVILLRRREPRRRAIRRHDVGVRSHREDPRQRPRPRANPRGDVHLRLVRALLQTHGQFAADVGGSGRGGAVRSVTRGVGGSARRAPRRVGRDVEADSGDVRHKQTRRPRGHGRDQSVRGGAQTRRRARVGVHGDHAHGRVRRFEESRGARRRGRVEGGG